jgi:hypothetical protein
LPRPLTGTKPEQHPLGFRITQGGAQHLRVLDRVCGNDQVHVMPGHVHPLHPHRAG